MKSIAILAAIAALLIVGCGPKEEAAAPTSNTNATATPPVVVAYEIGTKKKGDKGVCVICNAKEGTTAEEEVTETLDYQGKTYIFCNESEKADFIADPTKYVKK